MMILARQYARGLIWLAVGYFIVLEAAMIAAILYWPKFRDNTPALAKLIPFQSLQDLLTAVQQSGYWPYFAIQHWFKGCSLFGVAAIAFMGSGIIAREADQRTAEFLFSRPVSRRRVLRVEIRRRRRDQRVERVGVRGVVGRHARPPPQFLHCFLERRDELVGHVGHLLDFPVQACVDGAWSSRGGDGRDTESRRSTSDGVSILTIEAGPSSV